MTRHLLLALLFSITVFVQATAQGLAIESETAVDGKGVWANVQFATYDWSNTHLLARFYWVEDDLMGVDLSVGAIVRLGSATLKPYVGVDTDARLVAGTLIVSTAGHGVAYFVEARIFGEPKVTVVHRLTTTVAKDGSWQLRLEAVQAGKKLVLLSSGVEYSAQVLKGTRIFLAPSYDLVSRSSGFAFGLRIE